MIVDMTTVTFLNAFRRFMSRRGKPGKILSDNASQFRLAALSLKKLNKEQEWASTWGQTSQSEEVKKFLAEQRIDWKFMPQFSPWSGGVHERL
uniref:Integrase catalytic domain-containing protein n=1 Tax=Ditylenchus dipsaci TaxID=166011 RepID=A0A915DGB6_9BILA